MFPRHAPGTATLGCTLRLQIRLFRLIVPQVWARKDTVLVSWLPQYTAEHVWSMRKTCRLLCPIQECVLIVVQRFLSCTSMNLPFPKRTAVRSASILVRVVRQTVTFQSTKYSTKGCACSNVSPTVRVADVRVQKVKADDKLTFPHHKGQVLL